MGGSTPASTELLANAQCIGSGLSNSHTLSAPSQFTNNATSSNQPAPTSLQRPASCSKTETWLTTLPQHTTNQQELPNRKIVMEPKHAQSCCDLQCRGGFYEGRGKHRKYVEEQSPPSKPETFLMFRDSTKPQCAGEVPLRSLRTQRCGFRAGRSAASRCVHPCTRSGARRLSMLTGHQQL